MAEPFQSSPGNDVTPILASNETNPPHVDYGDKPPPYRPPLTDYPRQIGQPTQSVAFNPEIHQLRSDADGATAPIIVQFCGLEIIEHNILTFFGNLAYFLNRVLDATEYTAITKLSQTTGVLRRGHCCSHLCHLFNYQVGYTGHILNSFSKYRPVVQ